MIESSYLRQISEGSPKKSSVEFDYDKWMENQKKYDTYFDKLMECHDETSRLYKEIDALYVLQDDAISEQKAKCRQEMDALKAS